MNVGLLLFTGCIAFASIVLALEVGRQKLLWEALLAVAVTAVSVFIWLWIYGLNAPDGTNSTTRLLSAPNGADIVLIIVAIAGGAYAVISQFRTERVHVLTSRRDWVEGLRDDLARFHVLDNRLINKCQDQEVIDEFINVSSRIRLRLTSSGNDGNDPEQQNLDNFVRERTSIHMRDHEIFDKLVTSARPTLKQAWKQAVNELN